MNDAPADAREQQVDEVIAAFLEAEQAGHTVDTPDGLLARYPDLADDLRSFFADRDCFARVAGPPACAGLGLLTAEQPAPDVSTLDGGRYVGMKPHARGGLGEVYTATDTELNRVVALKRLQDCHAANTPSKRHFLQEAEITARLDHPGVVPVHSLFRDEAGQPCYAMRFIEGQTLDDALRAYHAGPADPVGFRRLLRSFVQVCETIAYAHSRGVLHRDLKPRNIMLGKFGETVVVDWGLAKVIGRAGEAGTVGAEDTLRPAGDSAGEQTQMGAAVGTPAYMSPEQAAGRWDVIGPASDVYNLGAVLYALLTGRAPLEGGNWPELQQKIQRGHFPRPREVNRAAPQALEAVCLKAMALRPEDRYPSARALADDVELWLADEPVRAYREPAADRLWRWARRRRGLVCSGISGIIAVVTLAVASWIVSLERQNAEYERKLRFLQVMQMNDRVTTILQHRHYGFYKSVRDHLDEVTGQVSQDPRLNDRELPGFRREILWKVQKFWEDSKLMDGYPTPDPRSRTQFANVQSALCLARLGEHERAAAEARRLEDWATTHLAMYDPPGKASYDVARMYGVCAAAAKDNGELAQQYGDRAMQLLRKADEAGYFEEVARAERLKNDRDLDALRSREDFGKLHREVEAKLK
jgi:hypothetical protein